MRSFTSHYHPPIAGAAASEKPPVLVPEGFSLAGLVLGWVALLRPGAWLVAALAGTAALLAALLARLVPGAWVLLPALHLVVGLFANDWRRWELGMAGYRPGPVVAGADRAGALLRLLDRHPGWSGGTAPA